MDSKIVVIHDLCEHNQGGGESDNFKGSTNMSAFLMVRKGRRSIVIERVEVEGREGPIDGRRSRSQLQEISVRS